MDMTQVDVKPNTIPTDLAALGAVRGFNPRPAHRLRQFIVGPEGQGKTSYLLSMPQSLLLDFEHGAHSVTHQRAVRISIRDYEHYREVMNWLKQSAKKGELPFAQVAFDTGDRWIEMLAEHLADEREVEDITSYGDQGAGYKLVNNLMWSDLHMLEDAGYAWIIVGHIMEKTVRIAKVEHTVLREAMWPKTAAMFRKSCDILGFIGIRTQNITTPGKVVTLKNGKSTKLADTVETKQTYCLTVMQNEVNEGKMRLPIAGHRLTLPPHDSWAAFVRVYNEAAESAREEEKKDKFAPEPEGETKVSAKTVA